MRVAEDPAPRTEGPRQPARRRFFEKRLSPSKITLTYVVGVSLWIIWSDRLVDLMGAPILHTFKGLFFVALSGGALYFYLRRKADQQRTIERTLAAASESKSRLVSAVGHDLRQPLQSIGLFAAVVQNDPNLEPRSREAVVKLGQSVERMGQLLKTILDLAELDVRQHAAQRLAVRLDALLPQLVEEMAPQAGEKGLALSCVRTSLVVDSDPVLLLTILRNLIANAVRYTDQGRILVGCRRRGAEVAIEIHDTGVGIEQDKLALVFEEFYQIGNSARDSRLGLGLGLAIVDRLSRLLGHRVAVRSHPGRGTVFSVLVPCSRQTMETGGGS